MDLVELLKRTEGKTLESRRDEKDGKVGIVGYEINFNRYF